MAQKVRKRPESVLLPIKLLATNGVKNTNLKLELEKESKHLRYLILHPPFPQRSQAKKKVEKLGPLKVGSKSFVFFPGAGKKKLIFLRKVGR